MGAWMRLRREDMRVMVACGAAGAIAAAFNGPLTGAFYAFELVLAQYAVGYVAPDHDRLDLGHLGHACVWRSTVRAIGSTTHVTSPQATSLGSCLLGIVCAVIGIFWMRTLPLVERLLSLTDSSIGPSHYWRPHCWRHGHLEPANSLGRARRSGI